MNIYTTNLSSDAIPSRARSLSPSTGISARQEDTVMPASTCHCPGKPRTLLQLATLYGVSDKTMRKWLRPFAAEIGSRNGYYYSIVQQRTVFEKLGDPGEGEDKKEKNRTTRNCR